MTLAEWFEIWMEVYEINLRDSTRHNYITMFDKIKEEIGDVKMKDMSLTVVQKHLIIYLPINIGREQGLYFIRCLKKL